LFPDAFATELDSWCWKAANHSAIDRCSARHWSAHANNSVVMVDGYLLVR